MDNKLLLEEVLKEVDKHPELMSRRDALKYLTISPLAASAIAGTTVGSSELKASNAKGKIVIVGGGLAGISTAARLNNALSNADITIIEPDPLSASYQPGYTLIAGGIWNKSQVLYDTVDKIPNGVKHIKGKATSFDPDNNKLTVDGKEEISYDQLILAVGVTLDYAAIKGLSGEITSSSKDLETVKSSGMMQNGLHSMYFLDGATATWDGVQELIEKAKSHTGPTKLKALFTQPDTAIKCGGAPKKIMYLAHARLVEAGVRDKVEMVFNANGETMLIVPEFNEAIEQQFKDRGFKWNYRQNLIEIDAKNKIAVFDKRVHSKGEWDDLFEEYSTVVTHERIETPYDFIHVTPPMKVHDTVGKSALGSPHSWIPVNKETLQHVKFDNVWSIGDAAAIPLAKTGGSVRKQYKVLVDNVIAKMEKKDTLPAKYDGYTVCPFTTDLGKVMLAEFDWSRKPTPMIPLDPTKERWIWWLLKVYMLKPMTVIGMMKGYA